MTVIHKSGVIIECVRGDIAHQPEIDVVVNAANARLLPGAGVAGALHRAAGPELARECGGLAPIAVGEAVISGGHRLPNRHVIHCLGPVYGADEPAAELLASCYRKALRLADRRGLASIAFPAISTGVFGYPLREAAAVAIAAVLAEIPQLSAVRRIRFVLFSDGDLEIFEQQLAASESQA